ncbi:MAG TPA: hypothetical protein VE690_12570, partial [Rhodopila sp.]|nr:hypothetical protein [Rhodopila sp.]
MMRGVWHCSQLLHWLAHIAFGVCVVAAVAVSVGAWRLSQGPVDVSWLSERARVALLDEASPVQVRFDHAWLAWGGWTKRLDHLIELQVLQVVVQGGGGQALAEAPRAW